MRHFIILFSQKLIMELSNLNIIEELYDRIHNILKNILEIKDYFIIVFIIVFINSYYKYFIICLYFLKTILYIGSPDTVFKRFNPHHGISSVDFFFLIFKYLFILRSFVDHLIFPYIKQL